ncbi:hypothetical protein PsYK624_162710 [Phanerochaete sordida]|uniref:Uncharacterized protein n=1 Tax=Phanerochaete sordida TaxID=48140 RepID=A0A9P3GQI3_9APHY|nr:hypothetical protein PsYK624_162710 [Phanerochaete sordida]
MRHMSRRMRAFEKMRIPPAHAFWWYSSAFGAALGDTSTLGYFKLQCREPDHSSVLQLPTSVLTCDWTFQQCAYATGCYRSLILISWLFSTSHICQY